jgi:hypothetical protein
VQFPPALGLSLLALAARVDPHEHVFDDDVAGLCRVTALVDLLKAAS